MKRSVIDTSRSIECSFQQTEDQQDALIYFGRHPFISSIDVEEEYLTIYNPLSTELNVCNYSLVDSKHHHTFTLPEEAIIPAQGTLYVYTCPGGNHQSRFQTPHVLWTNHDGSLRRKEVLNNRKIALYNLI